MQRMQRWYIFASLASLYFWVYFHRVAPAVVAFDLMQEFEASSAILGLMSATYFYTYAIVQIPIGVLSDSLGTRKTVTAFSFIAFTGSILFAFASDIQMLTIGRALIGFGLGGIFIPTLKAVAEWFHPSEFATLNGLLVAIGNLGGLIASAPLALLTLAVGWRYSFAAIAIITLILTGIVWLVVRDSPLKVTVGYEELDEELDEWHCQGRYEVKRAISIIFKKREFWLLAIVAFLSYGTLMSFQGLWGGPFLIENYKFDKATAGGILMSTAIGVMIGCPLGGLLSDRCLAKKKSIFIFGVLLYTLAWLPLAFAQDSLNFPSLTLICFTLGLAFGISFIMLAIARELFPKQIVGTALGSLNIFFFLGAASYQSSMGYLLFNFNFNFNGYSAMFKFYLGSMILASLAAASLAAVLVREKIYVD
jgi:sugar phosphate permease